MLGFLNSFKIWNLVLTADYNDKNCYRNETEVKKHGRTFFIFFDIIVMKEVKSIEPVPAKSPSAIILLRTSLLTGRSKGQEGPESQTTG